MRVYFTERDQMVVDHAASIPRPSGGGHHHLHRRGGPALQPRVLFLRPDLLLRGGGRGVCRPRHALLHRLRRRHVPEKGHPLRQRGQCAGIQQRVPRQFLRPAGYARTQRASLHRPGGGSRHPERPPHRALRPLQVRLLLLRLLLQHPGMHLQPVRRRVLRR